MKTKATDLKPVKLTDVTSEHGYGLACSCTFHCHDSHWGVADLYCKECGGYPKYGYLQKEIDKILQQKNDKAVK